MKNIELNEEQIAYLQGLNSDKNKKEFLLTAIIQNLGIDESANNRGHLSTRHKARPEDIISGTEEAYKIPIEKKYTLEDMYLSWINGKHRANKIIYQEDAFEYFIKSLNQKP